MGATYHRRKIPPQRLKCWLLVVDDQKGTLCILSQAQSLSSPKECVNITQDVTCMPTCVLCNTFEHSWSTDIQMAD